MSGDDTRRLLKMLGMAVTRYEDVVRNRATPSEVRAAEAEARSRLQEVTALIERLRAQASADR